MEYKTTVVKSSVPYLLVLASLVGCAAGPSSTNSDAGRNGGQDSGFTIPAADGGAGAGDAIVNADASPGAAGAGGTADAQLEAGYCDIKFTGGIEQSLNLRCGPIIETHTDGPGTELITAALRGTFSGFDIYTREAPHVGALDPSAVFWVHVTYAEGTSPDSWAVRRETDGTTIGSWSLTISSLGTPSIDEASQLKDFSDAHGTFTATMAYVGSGPKRPDAHVRVDF